MSFLILVKCNWVHRKKLRTYRPQFLGQILLDGNSTKFMEFAGQKGFHGNRWLRR
jgi:hypothetical protein